MPSPVVNLISNAYDAAIQGSVISPEALIDIDKFDPYIATIDRNSRNINYTLLKNVGVIGVVAEAGYLYNAVHTKVTYQNPRLHDQIEQIESAGLPYGLYATTKARSVKEAKEELKELSLIIQTYPPQLGMWLKLSMTSNKTINNSIVDTYYDRFIELGLKDQIGFYATRSQLNHITWAEYQSDWYLWLDDHVTSFVDLNQLLTPQFFDL